MYARVTKWEGAEPDALRKFAEQVNASSEPPPGVPATGFTMLMDPDNGHSLSIALFETEEDMRKGDEALSAMTPSADGGRRVSVEMYEVGADIRR